MRFRQRSRFARSISSISSGAFQLPRNPNVTPNVARKKP